MGQTDLIRQAVKCFAREDAQEHEEAVALLYELSKSYPFCEKIGATSGAILFLVGLTSNESGHIRTAEVADKVLKNLEQCDNNVMQMAENGRLQPLLDRLIAGDASFHKTVFRTYLYNVVRFFLVARSKARFVWCLWESTKVMKSNCRNVILPSLWRIHVYEVPMVVTVYGFNIHHVSISLEYTKSTFNNACVNAKTMPENWFWMKSNMQHTSLQVKCLDHALRYEIPQGRSNENLHYIINLTILWLRLALLKIQTSRKFNVQ